MCCWTNKLIQRALLLALCHFILAKSGKSHRAMLSQVDELRIGICMPFYYHDNYYLTIAARNELISVTNAPGDACPGDVLTYNCIIIGGGNTIWSGTAFNCPSKSNETILRHSQFARGTFGSCNDGAITARSLGVVNSCYSSQLNVTVSSDMNNQNIQCAHSSDRIVTIGVETLSITTGK